jgi:murein DD-endopeptidase MepM/ murein hydrolase activator NlpD
MFYRIGLILLSSLILSSNPVSAFEINGELAQGGLVIGHVAPGTQILAGNNQIDVSPEGDFLIGFGRDAPLNFSLKITHMSGVQEIKTLKIKQRSWKISRVDGLPGRKVTPKPEDLRRIRADSAQIKKVRRLRTKKTYFRSGFQWPVVGRISGVFGSQRILNGNPRRPHVGTDIAAPIGTPVKAIADGVVVLVHPDMFFTGKTMMIDHGHGLASVYAHLNKMVVKKGQHVTKGTVIGHIGKTGRATGPHLHWGISLFSTHLDPQLVVGAMPSEK